MMRNGRQSPSRRSEKARLKMKMFLAVLIFLFLSTADMTTELLTTAI